jgi:hypothetical protein
MLIKQSTSLKKGLRITKTFSGAFFDYFVLPIYFLCVRGSFLQSNTIGFFIQLCSDLNNISIEQCQVFTVGADLLSFCF